MHILPCHPPSQSSSKHLNQTTQSKTLSLVPLLMMRRQNNEPTVVHSSIALLQERFRQLQRVKEMREEKELLRGFSMTTTTTATTTTESEPKWVSNSNLMGPSRPLSGSKTLPDERPDFRALETSLSIGLWPNRSANTMQISPSNRGETDVDTSLHL